MRTPVWWETEFVRLAGYVLIAGGSSTEENRTKETQLSWTAALPDEEVGKCNRV